jgi:hypothetical protein
MSHARCKLPLGFAAVLVAAAVTAHGLAAEPTGDKVSIETLLRSGWQVAGYTSTFDNRSSFVLFKHPNETYLVQCLTSYDVQRTPRVTIHCYDLR